MAHENFTQIHNLVVRGKTAIHTRYVGVWGFITSHTEGWKLTETSIARELSVGTDFVRSALNAIESAGCLIRTRQRNAQGKLGESSWFVTDLPLQLQQLGITDPETVAAKVHEAYEQWRHAMNESTEGRFPSAAPTPENPTLEVPSENGDHQHAHEPAQQRFPSAAPNSGFPSLDEPSLGEPTTKKTKEKKTKEKKTNQPVANESTAIEPANISNSGWLDQGSATTDEHTKPAVANDGAADSSSHADQRGAPETSAGAGLLATLERRYSAHLHAGRARHVQVVDDALAVLTRNEVTSALGDGLETATRPSGALVARINGLPQRVAARQAQHQERAEWQRRAEVNAERNQAAPRPTEPEQAPQQPSSPVDWLSDKQYAELRKADQVQLRVWSEASEERFHTSAPARLVALRNKVTATHEGDAA